MWKRVAHPNIVALLGITTSPRPQLISDWMSGGDLPKYVKKYPDADRPGLVHIPLVGFAAHLLPSPAFRRCQWPQLPPFMQCNTWEPQGSK